MQRQPVRRIGPGRLAPADAVVKAPEKSRASYGRFFQECEWVAAKRQPSNGPHKIVSSTMNTVMGKINGQTW
jgi:hypothetical protein